MAVATATVVSDSVTFLRDALSNNITDPVSGSRSGRDRFVMTAYPQRPVKYPIITVRMIGGSATSSLGMQSEASVMRIPMEVRVWASNQKQKDNLTEQVLNYLRGNQFGTGSSTENGLHDFKINSMVNVDEPGEDGIRSKVIEITFMFIY